MATKKTNKPSKKQTRPTFADGDAGKKERFNFYAQLRMTRALKLIYQLKNLTNPVIYASTEDQRRKMVDTLQGAVNELESRYFQVSGPAKTNKFQF